MVSTLLASIKDSFLLVWGSFAAAADAPAKLAAGAVVSAVAAAGAGSGPPDGASAGAVAVAGAVVGRAIPSSTVEVVALGFATPAEPGLVLPYLDARRAAGRSDG